MSRQINAGWLAVAVAAMALPALGSPITVTNGSFEMPDVVNTTGGSPTHQTAAGGAQNSGLTYYTTQLATSGAHFYAPSTINDAIPYWSVTTVNDTVGGVQQAYGINDPVGAAYFGTSGGAGGGFVGLTNNTNYTFNALASNSGYNSAYGYGFADGYQYAYANLPMNASIKMIYNPSDPNTGDPAGTGQSLGNFIPGDSYALSVSMGAARNGGTYNYSIVVLDNGAPVTSMSGSSPATAAGDWLQVVVPYTAVDSGAIGIELDANEPNATTGVANFDNVLLNDLGPAGAPSFPEPASLGVLGIGVLALRRRHH